MNEFKYMEGDRELLLKLLDRSLVVLNRKYKDPINIELDSKFITISNYSLKDQGMEDVAVLNRLKSYEFPVSFENFRYKYESILEELPVFIYFCIQAFHCKYYKDFEIIRSDIYQLDK
jgi:phage/plasmid-associated DNA primase